MEKSREVSTLEMIEAMNKISVELKLNEKLNKVFGESLISEISETKVEKLDDLVKRLTSRLVKR